MDEHTQFHQPNSKSQTLNRVKSNDPSRIAGRLSANGNIILVNPNGVFFDGTSRVDVNAIVATTADIATKEFMNGSNHFNRPGNPDAAIINEGLITAKEAGLVGLVAPHVINNGIIQAKAGRVQLASGDTVTLDFYGDDLLKVEVLDEEVKSQLVANLGVLSADGGTVAMTAAAARKTVNSLIVAEGRLEARTVGRDQTGAIIIGAEGSNKSLKEGDAFVSVSGDLNASGRQEGQQGGNIEILGDHISLASGAIFDASGHSAPVPRRKPGTGSATTTAQKEIRTEKDFLAQDSRAGGSIKIGGDYLGTGDTQTAKTTSVAKETLIVNDALAQGDGGRTIIWSDQTTDFHGNIFARGGADSGHGGFVETSGKENLKADGYVDLSSRKPGFNNGTYLLDPANITIYGNVDPTFVSTDSSIDLTTNLRIWLDGSDIDGDGIDEGALEDGLDGSSQVLTWVDKSPSGNNATGSGATLGDINGNTTVRFTGNIYTAADSFGGSIGQFSTFLISQENARSANLLLNYNGANSATRVSIHAPWSTGDWFWDAGNTGNQRTTISGNPTAVGAVTLMDFYKSNGLNGFSLNGEAHTVSRGGATVASSTGGLRIGLNTGVDPLDHEIGEIITYEKRLLDDERDLLLQYQSAKWGREIDSGGTGNNEAERAMAADGYGAFTTQYLERLSQTADIVLQADDTITLDLQGATIAADTGRSISLITTNGDINDVSAGTIRSDSGNINITAGGTGSISLDTTNLDAQNGLVNLNAAGSILLQQTESLNLGTVIANETIEIRTTGATSDLITNGTITANNNSAANNAVTLSTIDQFTNNTGAGLFTIGNGGRWLVYSADPANNTLGGLSSDFKRYNRTFAGNAPASITEPGNGLLYSIAPTLTFDASNHTIEYGDAFLATPTTTYSSGLIDGDTIGDIGQTGEVAFGGYSQGDDAGTYALEAGTLSNDLGYQYAFTNGTLTVDKAPLDIAASGFTREYGDNNPADLGGFTYSGFKLTDTAAVIDTDATLATTLTNASDAGTYNGAVTLSSAFSDNNYTYSNNFTAGDVTIDQAQLDIAASGFTREYGDNNPADLGGVTYSGFKLTDTAAVIDTDATLATTLTNASDAGTYNGAVTLGSAFSDNNYVYSGTLTGGNVTIDQAELDIAASGFTREYGDNNPADLGGVTYSGFKLTDTAAVIDTDATLATTLTNASDAGTYNGAVTLGSAFSDNNYTYSNNFTAGDVTIDQAQLDITANGFTREYGDNNPADLGGVTYSGFKLTDTAAVIDTDATLATTLTNASDAGTYNGAVTLSSAFSDNNYTYSNNFTAGDVTIDKAELTASISPSTLSKMQGEVNPSFSITYSGFKLNQTTDILDLLPEARTSATSASPAGTYPILLTGGMDNNYSRPCENLS